MPESHNGRRPTPASTSPLMWHITSQPLSLSWKVPYKQINSIRDDTMLIYDFFPSSPPPSLATINNLQVYQTAWHLAFITI